MAIDYTVKGEWTVENGSHAYVVKAVTKTGRIAGKVTLYADLDTTIALNQFINSMAKAGIEQAAEETLRKLVDARHTNS